MARIQSTRQGSQEMTAPAPIVPISNGLDATGYILRPARFSNDTTVVTLVVRSASSQAKSAARTRLIVAIASIRLPLAKLLLPKLFVAGCSSDFGASSAGFNLLNIENNCSRDS